MFFSRSKSKLGVDIGTSTIKVVQLKRDNGKFLLETYGMVNAASQVMSKADVDVISQTAGVLKTLLEKAKVTTKKVIASLPNNIVFVSVIDMPALSDKELKNAIEWEARRYVPLPLEEVTLSWSVMRESQTAEKIKVLITAVPTTVIENYLRMFKLAGLDPQALEIEALALIRSLAGSRQDAFIIVDIGARNTSLNLVDKGFLRISRNLPVGGDTITSGIAQSLKISPGRAEQFKMDLGLSGDLQQIPQVMKASLESIKNETGQLVKIYEASGGTISEIIFAGSGAYLPGLSVYFSDLGIKASLGNPFKFIEYDERLKTALPKVSMGLSIALGLAMRE
ncbi:MAG: hypothetical protein A3C85_03070 [Candidatus Doudnabacteria bacterium RIFCSPHIGHO2_02_FULL_48_21]|uniref:SHS2 domain-containing protein n=1 Tax=Candidatus Doudnabacteria bacterium RIFCSPLOWO2_02_FULL_48_13 TaxID=1817845 RepID=A0A1F5QC09_9BACT|nr:MAG: hypothetical protein A3K05_00330 [Candidatus Doudnabacteria bacterium RIFCSPHIGHO2_01_48_18]OGE77086.1 MAG: hypothetical protein A2668_02440 [Candidatus Doudnabacteria bacterium RIFCSPHIGHO2_01_FULL_48_180]OGE91627.1 MAG: hypothetical protein A3F44_02900 [Candidatus Doudnabacteria bacterium RIFCSPHIGHO2_12_FULL_47_25]OGE93241.1 MAG: hypothetical protein A3C85_03070 [Candidatus Doudnabacteria bacterium RIFCSPHIGHO2_02_FULL_48_21]OGE96364.1 MAG: hypothetical protein A3A83_01315 [Candidatu